MTIKDIAKRLNVSGTAVSQALNHTGHISDTLRTRILREAEVVGYRRNRSAAELVQHRWHNPEARAKPRNIALITQADNEYKSFGQNIKKLASTYAREAGHGFFHIDLACYSQEKTWKNLLNTRGVEGIIITAGFEESLLRDPFWENFVVVKCGLLQEGDLAHGVHDDMFSRLHRASGLLASRGYQKLGFVLLHHTPCNSDDLQRLGALRTIPDCYPDLILKKPLMFPFSQFGGCTKPLYASDSNFHKLLRPLIEQVAQWINTEMPEVVIGMNDLVLHALTKGGFRVPEDISFISLNLSEESLGYNISPTGYYRRRGKMVTQTLQLLEQLMQNPIRVQGSPLRVIVPSEFHEGNTLLK